MKKILTSIATSLLFLGMNAAYSDERNNQVDSLMTNEGYPYNMLVQRTDEVKLIYNNKSPMTCRVEVNHNGQVWRGQTYSTSEKRFLAKPLARCMDRTLAKEIVKTTF